MTATVADAEDMVDQLRLASARPCIDAATGLISGTPTAAGQFDFQVLAKMNGDTRSDTKALGIVVREPVAIARSRSVHSRRAARSAEVSAPFDAMLAATGGTGTYTWSLTSGSAPTRAHACGRRDRWNSDDRRRLPLHRDRHRLGRTRCELSRADRRRSEARRLDARSSVPAKVGKFYGAKVKTLGGVKPRRGEILRGPLPRGVRFDRTTGRSSGSRSARAAFA